MFQILSLDCSDNVAYCCSDYGIATYINIVKKALDIMHIVVPIILIVMATVQMIKLMADPDDKNKNLRKVLLNKFVAAVIVFFLPLMVSITIKLVVPKNFELSKCWDDADQIVKTMDQYKTYYDSTNSNVQINSHKSTYKGKALKYGVPPRGKAANTIKSNSNDTGIPGETLNGKKHKLTKSEIKYLAKVCVSEQGSSADGIRGEANLMANLYELSGKKFSSVYDFVKNSNWFADPEKSATKKAINIVESVLVDGNRTIPFYINEHDCWFCHRRKDRYEFCSNGNRGDICSISGGSSRSYITKRSHYKKDKTVIKNVYSSTYTFYYFPTSSSDPFGYTKAAYNKIKSKNR